MQLPLLEAEHNSLRLDLASVILALYFAGFLTAGRRGCRKHNISDSRRRLFARHHRADRASFHEIKIAETVGGFFQGSDSVAVVVQRGGGFGEEGGGGVVAVSVVGFGVLFGGADPVVRGRGWDRRGCEFSLSLFLLLFGEEIVRSVGWRLQTPVFEAFFAPIDTHALAVADDDIAGADGVESQEGSASANVTSDLG